MKDEDVNRGSVHVSDDVLDVSPNFLFYLSAFFMSLRTFYYKKEKSDAFPVYQLVDILVGLCYNVTSVI